MRVLSLSTQNEPCGIATYNDQLRAAFSSLGHQYDVFPIDIDRYQRLARVEIKSYFDPFIEQAANYDAIVLQHEYGLYDAGYSIKEAIKVFSSIVRSVSALNKPTLVFFHSDPPTFERQLAKLLSSRRRAWELMVHVFRRHPNMHIFVHGPDTRRRYIDRGLPKDRVIDVIHPFPVRPNGLAPWQPKDAQRDDITLTIFGFVSEYKGYDTALHALSLLPINYRLVIAGGPHPRALRDRTLDKILESVGISRVAFEMPTAQQPAAGPPQRGTPSNRRIVMTGWLTPEQVQSILGATDIVLAPYKEKGPSGSGAVTWGLASGRPVIATRTRPFLALNRAERCLQLVSADAPFELARAIIAVASDRAEQERMVSAGLALAERYDWSRFAKFLLPYLTASA